MCNIVFSPPKAESRGLHDTAYSVCLSPYGALRHRDWFIAEWPILRGERVLDDFKTYGTATSTSTSTPSITSSTSSSSTTTPPQVDRRNQEPSTLATRYTRE
jgi:hypothetical protein